MGMVMDMDTDFEFFFKWVGRGTLIAYGVLFYLLWVLAYINPGHKVLVTVDSLGEANLELFIIPLFLVIGIWSALKK